MKTALSLTLAFGIVLSGLLGAATNPSLPACGKNEGTEMCLPPPLDNRAPASTARKKKKKKAKSSVQGSATPTTAQTKSY